MVRTRSTMKRTAILLSVCVTVLYVTTKMGPQNQPDHVGRLVSPVLAEPATRAPAPPAHAPTPQGGNQPPAPPPKPAAVKHADTSPAVIYTADEQWKHARHFKPI